jgi:hypothetical protein
MIVSNRQAQTDKMKARGRSATRNRRAGEMPGATRQITCYNMGLIKPAQSAICNLQ